MIRPAYIYLRDFFIYLLYRNMPELKGHAVAVYNARQQVVQCNDIARGHGVKPAMRVKKATSFVSSLALFPIPDLSDDPLGELGRKLLAFSPQVARFGAHDLVVETALSDHLAGGLKPLVATFYKTVVDAGFDPYIGVACSLADARLAACFRTGNHAHVVFVEPDDTSLAANLALDSLYSMLEFKPSAPGRRLFAYLGLKTLEDVKTHASAIRLSLLNRETEEILLYATRCEHLEKRLTFIREEARLKANFCFSPAINRVSSLFVPLENLLELLMHQAEERKELAAELELRFITDCGQEELLRVRSVHPGRRVADWMMLVQVHMENLSLERPLAELLVEIVHRVPQARSDGDLFDRGRKTQTDMRRLGMHLESMLGPGQGLFQVECKDAHLPEEQFYCRGSRPSHSRGSRPSHSRGSRPSHSTVPASDLPPVIFPNPLPFEETGQGKPLYEFEFHDPGSHEVVRHNYFAYHRTRGAALLIRRTGEAAFVIGLLDPPVTRTTPLDR